MKILIYFRKKKCTIIFISKFYFFYLGDLSQLGGVLPMELLELPSVEHHHVEVLLVLLALLALVLELLLLLELLRDASLAQALVF